MRRFFLWYQWVVPGLGFPAAFWVWDRELSSGSAAAWFMGSLVLWGYLVPGLGTSVTRLYEFRTGVRWGRMRPQQGFVLATAAAWIAWLSLGWGGWVFSALACAGLVTLYDAAAIRAGFIVVYNKPHFLGQSPWAVALDYAPVFFFAYGAVLGVFAQALATGASFGPDLFAGWLAMLVLAPIAALAAWSWLRHGYSGLIPYRGQRA